MRNGNTQNKEFEENKRRWQLDYQLSLDRYATEKAQWEKNYLMSQAQLAMQQDQFEYEKSLRDTNKKQQDLQYAANVKDYLNMVLPDVANTYMAYINSGDSSKAANYLGQQAKQLSEKYGVDGNSIIKQVGDVYQYNSAYNTIHDPTISAGLSDARNKKLAANIAGLAVAPITMGLTLPYFVGKYKEADAAYDKYKKTIEDAEANFQKYSTNLPSWYTGYAGQ